MVLQCCGAQQDNIIHNSFDFFNIFRLKTIDLFESCSIQVGDTHWYTIKDSDNLMTLKQWRSKCTEAFNIGPGSIHSKTNKEKHNNKLLGTKNPSKSTHHVELEPINRDDLLSMYISMF